MEYNWSLLNNSNGTSSTTTAYNSVRSHNNGHHAWETTWGSVSHNGGGVISREENWSYPLHSYCSTTPSAFYGDAAARQVEFSAYDHQAVMLQEQEKISTCLKLGKRHYFEDVMAAPPPTAAAAAAMTKKGKPYCAMAAAEAAQTAVAARCQVEGCGVVLVNAKEYHRRHKVCEMHAKAPRVVVLGIEQRFCQQCSRFHAVSEFDESKRSCRRRLAGHNERRRKSTLEQHHSHKHSQGGRSHDPHSAVNGGECALSLLSSTNYSPSSWNSVVTSASAHLPERCSAALRELIAENRASVLACKKKLIPNSYINDQMENYSKLTGSALRVGLNAYENGAGHVTLDLMRARNSALGFLSGKESDAQNCSELWKVPMGY